MVAVCVESVHVVAVLVMAQVTLVDDPFTRSVQVTDWPDPGAVAATQPKFLKVPLMATYLLTVDSAAEADGQRPSSA